MSKVTVFPIPEQDMQLPNGQDVIADVPPLGWTDGPLPSMDLELAAAELFADSHPRGLWAEPSMKAERDQARKQILRAYVRFLQMQRWTLENAVEKLTDQSCQLVYGDRRLGSTIRNQVRDFAESYLEDLAKLFPRKLFYPRDVEANTAEVAKESVN